MTLHNTTLVQDMQKGSNGIGDFVGHKKGYAYYQNTTVPKVKHDDVGMLLCNLDCLAGVMD